MEWKNLYRGFIMGISDLIPGVSGGTIAVILGIYDRLLDAISGFFSRRWKEQLGFLIPLAVGMGAALLLLSRLIEFLLTNYHEPTQFFFIGLIIGVIPLMLKQAQPKKNFDSKHYITFVIAAILIASMAFLNPEKTTEPITSLSVLSVIGLFFSGWLASMAMLLPGISGSFILLLLGVYSTAINALSTLNIPVILVIGLGAVVGFIGSSKGIKYSLSHFPHITYAIIIGLIIGSLFVVFPGIITGMTTIILCLITFVLGLSVTMLFGSEKKLIKGKSNK